MAKHTKGRRVGSTKKHGRRGTRSQCGGDIFSGGEGLYALASGSNKVMSWVLDLPTQTTAAEATAENAPTTQTTAENATAAEPPTADTLTTIQKDRIKSLLDGAIRFRKGVQLYKITINEGESFSMTWTKIGAGFARSVGRLSGAVHGEETSQNIAAANIFAMYGSDRIKTQFLAAVKGIAYSSIPDKMTFTTTLITLEFVGISGFMSSKKEINVSSFLPNFSEDNLMRNIVNMYAKLN